MIVTSAVGEGVTVDGGVVRANGNPIGGALMLELGTSVDLVVVARVAHDS